MTILLLPIINYYRRLSSYRGNVLPVFLRILVQWHPDAIGQRVRHHEWVGRMRSSCVRRTAAARVTETTTRGAGRRTRWSIRLKSFDPCARTRYHYITRTHNIFEVCKCQLHKIARYSMAHSRVCSGVLWVRCSVLAGQTRVVGAGGDVFAGV